MNRALRPTVDSVQNILAQLLGPNVSVSEAIDYPLEFGIVSMYVSDKTEPLAMSIADTGMAVFAGSALLNVPSSDAHAMLNRGDIESLVFQSYEEIANILTRVLTDEGYEQLRLDRVHPQGKLSECDTPISIFDEKVSFHIEIGGYGTGVLTFHVR